MYVYNIEGVHVIKQEKNQFLIIKYLKIKVVCKKKSTSDFYILCFMLIFVY